MTQRETALLDALHTEAVRLGLEWDLVTGVDLPRLVGAIPQDLKADLIAAAEAEGWDPVEFMVLFLEPLLDEASREDEN